MLPLLLEHLLPVVAVVPVLYQVDLSKQEINIVPEVQVIVQHVMERSRLLLGMASTMFLMYPICQTFLPLLLHLLPIPCQESIFVNVNVPTNVISVTSL